ncbi:hypothetical protein DRE_06531 [Drechslerella stenobrocha 248]|uniref:FAD dependent oxidoreductase domain-containing protein n=1 Tax=Drechslerella stenobrocha 248 TaxID=1043628 RepID=W7HXV3_9PEZI|nr:hypothetical protein DRE_06531 [Drechslerella stenobrocha 248]
MQDSNVKCNNTPSSSTSSKVAPARRIDIVILGAGIIGLSTAFYLLHSSCPDCIVHVTILDSSPDLFACASGRAGGFLAKDWFAPASAALGELSFRLHRELADAYDGSTRWGYARSASFNLARRKRSNETTGSEQRISRRGEDWLRYGASRVGAAASGNGGDGAQRGLIAPTWLASGGCEQDVELSSTSETTAQVDPQELCEFLLGKIERQGAVVRHPVTPLRVRRTAAGELEGLVFADGGGEETIVLRSPSHGPQSSSNEGITPDCRAVFASIDGLSWCPEVFSRLNGELYLAGLNSSTIPLPDVATEVKVRDDDIGDLVSLANDLIKHSDGIETAVVRAALCHRPVTPTGHGPWGISLSLGSGKVMAEMMTGRTTSVDVSGLGLQ